MYEINLKTMVFLSKIIIPKMEKKNFGSMVHISSVDALSGDSKPQDAYGSSKAAMIRLSKSLAIQYAGKNIRSNVFSLKSVLQASPWTNLKVFRTSCSNPSKRLITLSISTISMPVNSHPVNDLS